MQTTTDDITAELEAMIDKHGLLHVVTGLELICREKAEHIRVNWQDHAMARTWDIAARHLDRTAHRLPVFP